MSYFPAATRAARALTGTVSVALLLVGCARPRPPAEPAGKAPPSAEGATKPSEKASAEVSREPPSDLATRENLPPAVRGALMARMDRHGEMLTLLLAMVVLLEYEDATFLAREIASEPKLGRPIPGETDTLNALLPASFFDYQDQLTARVNELAAATQARDNKKMSAAFGAVTETCVACHAAYLYEELDLAGPAHGRAEPDDL